MGGAAVMAGIEKPVPVPVRVVTAVDLKVSHGSLTLNLDSISFSYEDATSTVLCRGVVDGKRVEIGFQLDDCGCVIPLDLGEEFTYSALKFAWSISQDSHSILISTGE
jgi:hypothetical protein